MSYAFVLAPVLSGFLARWARWRSWDTAEAGVLAILGGLVMPQLIYAMSSGPHHWEGEASATLLLTPFLLIGTIIGLISFSREQ